MTTDLVPWLVLVRAVAAHGGRAPLVALLDRVGSPDAILALSAAELAAAGLPADPAASLVAQDLAGAEAEARWMRDENVTLVPRGAPGYPPLLAATADPPLALFVRGRPEALAAPQLAIVGSRNPTGPGRDTAQAFAAHLAGCGLAITSGLAQGIDAAAHEGALAAGGLTVAVCGTGLDVVYPASNRGLARRIALSGALVSEFPRDTPSRKANFPQRNRIIAGLSLGTLVVEAAMHSGSLITARQAAEAGREVFAIPGSIHSPLAKGCHRLIREGAKLVESGADVLEELGQFGEMIRGEAAIASPSPAPRARDGVRAGARANDPQYEKLLDEIGYDPTPIDVLVEKTGLAAGVISSMLLILELEGRVTAAPGGRYTRLTRGV
jgi:DNA processing protein